MQRSLDDLSTPLHHVTFAVVDLETTGASPGQCAVTEIGAVKMQGGHRLGTFQTLVNPGTGIPPVITHLTGITEAMVVPAPPIGAVLPSLLEFLGDAVVVGHNVRFDLRFLQASLAAHRRPALANRWVDTCTLARRLVGDEVLDCRLSTLATHLGLAHRPTHRALDDAMATADLLHHLLERAGTIGVLALEDLLDVPFVRGDPMLAKLQLAAHLPRRPGVYLFRDAGGQVIHVGTAVDLRRRVRAYFRSRRREVDRMLRQARSIDHLVCTGELEAIVSAVRLAHRLTPRFNRRSDRWRRYAYLKLTLDERFPRLSVVRVPRVGDGCLYLGPLPSARAARLAAEAVESAVPIRRCATRTGRTPHPTPCAPTPAGAGTCPCAGGVSEEDYASIVAEVVRGLTDDPGPLLQRLAALALSLADAGRHQEAAEVAERRDALCEALSRQRRLDALSRAGRVTLEVESGGGALLDRGRLVAAWSRDGEPAAHPPATQGPEPVPPGPPEGPLPRHLADEVLCVAAWIERRADRVRLVSCDGELAWPTWRIPGPERPCHDRQEAGAASLSGGGRLRHLNQSF